MHFWIFASVVLNSIFPTIYTLHTLETPIREAFLRPRNFNPHPYKQNYYNHLYDLQTNIDLNGVTSNYIEDAHNTKTGEFFPARHPSNGIRSQAPHQFPPTLAHSVNSRNLLIPYTKKIIQHRNGRINDVDSLYGTKQYAFKYSADDFSHNQQQNNGAVKGTYKVQLPDGRVQVVRYTADDNGYRADVSYLNNKNSVLKYDPTPRIIGPKVDHIPIFVHQQKDYINELSLEEKKSISAKATYIVSHKSTEVAAHQNPNLFV